MYGLAVIQTISNSTIIKNIDKALFGKRVKIPQVLFINILYFDHVCSLCQNFFRGTILKYKKDRDIWLIFEGLFIVLRREKECCNSTPKVYYPQLQLRLLEIGDRLVLILAGSEADADSKLEYLKTNAVSRQVLVTFNYFSLEYSVFQTKQLIHWYDMSAIIVSPSIWVKWASQNHRTIWP